MTELTDQQINDLIAQWVDQALSEDEEYRITRKPVNPEDLEDRMGTMALVLSDHREALALSDYRLVESTARSVLTNNGLNADPESFEFKKLCRELLKVSITIAEEARQKDLGIYPTSQVGGHVSTSFPGSSNFQVGKAASANPSNACKISKLFDEYERIMTKGGKWRGKTADTNRAVVRTMIELIGDLPVTLVDKEKARQYREGLERYPVNRNKDPQYKNKTIEQIFAMAKVDSISITTINNNLAKAAGLFSFAEKDGYIEKNPFRRMSLPNKARSKDAVQPFTDEELNHLFLNPHYLKHQYNQAFQFWLPLMGVFTGARIEELCQLYLKDIRQEDGVWCFDINETEDDQQLKNLNSKRLVPIHPTLIELGFLGFAKPEGSKNARLFPNLSWQSGKFSHYPGQWFGKYKTKLGFPKREKTFHSFRHTVISNLRRERIPPQEIQQLVGHETGSQTYDTYGKDEPIALLGALKQLHYEVDFRKLRYIPPSRQTK